MQAHTPQLLTPSPRFTGLTRSIPGRHWFAPDTFQKLIAASHTPVVGRLPNAFLPDKKEATPQDVLKALDELAGFLRPLRPLGTINLTAQLSPGLPPATIKRLGKGELGSVYAITIPEHQQEQQSIPETTFAFKVYHEAKSTPPDQHETHGPLAETSAGLFLAKPGVYKDLSQFHCANPTSGWALYEYISPIDSVKERPGPSFVEPNASGIKVNPGDDGHNRINGIRIDYGELNPVLPGTECPKFLTLQGFKAAVKSQYSEIREQAITNVKWLTPCEKEAAFEWVMQSPEFETNLKALMASYLYLFRSEDRIRLYRLAMDTQDLAVQIAAARMLSHLSSPSSLVNKCYEEGLALARAQNSHELEAAVVSNVHCLSPEKIKAAFDQALDSPHEDVQIAAVKTIAYFPDSVPAEGKVAAYKRALKSSFPSVQEAARIDFYRLTPAAKLSCFKTALAHPNGNIQKMASNWFSNLDDEHKAEAFHLLLQSKNLEIQTKAALELNTLPEAQRFEAFKLAMATGIAEIQAAAARHIEDLSAPDRLVSCESVLATGVSKAIAQLPNCISSLPANQRIKIFMRLINVPDEETQTNTACVLCQLPPKDIPAAYRAAIASPYSEAKVQAAASINSFPNDVARHFGQEAFKLAMQSKHPDVQAAAARSIIHLAPQTSIPSAYLSVLSTQNVDLQKAAIEWAPHFPEPYRNAAFKHAFQRVPASLKSWVVTHFIRNLKAKDAQPAAVRYLNHAKSQFTQLRDVQILTAGK
ncbi:MAG: hypothetical protein K2X01_05045 [Cyanobacteria bacterium]|nr:hypothetical protein [Cyanobacteriota bacterium]